MTITQFNNVVELIDVHNWKLSRAKAFVSQQFEIIVIARSKDEFITKLRNLVK